jgi:hypothetical protein
MRVSTRRSTNLVLAVTAAGLIGLGAAACSGGSPAQSAPAAHPAATSNTLDSAAGPGAPAAGSTPAAPASSLPPKAKPTAQPAAKPAAAPRTFAGSTLDVELTGYDAQSGLASFHKVVQDPNSPSAHLIPDPADPGTHRLRLSPNAPVTSNDPDGFPYETCPPVSCTAGDILGSVLGHQNDSLFAAMHVDAADVIDRITQSAY